MGSLSFESVSMAWGRRASTYAAMFFAEAWRSWSRAGAESTIHFSRLPRDADEALPSGRIRVANSVRGAWRGPSGIVVSERA